MLWLLGVCAQNGHYVVLRFVHQTKVNVKNRVDS